MKRMNLVPMLLLVVFAVHAQKKRPPVYKGSVGLSFNQGLWFPAKQEYSYYNPFLFLGSNPKYQYGTSINADFKLYKPIHAFIDLGVDKTTFSTHKVIWDTVEFVINGEHYRPRFVSYETSNWIRRSVLRSYVMGGLSYKLPIKKHLIIAGIGIYVPFYATFSEEWYFENTSGRVSRMSMKEPIFNHKYPLYYADKYGLLRIAYTKNLSPRWLLKVNLNYMMCKRIEGIRQLINLGIGLGYKI